MIARFRKYILKICLFDIPKTGCLRLVLGTTRHLSTPTNLINHLEPGALFCTSSAPPPETWRTPPHRPKPTRSMSWPRPQPSPSPRRPSSISPTARTSAARRCAPDAPTSRGVALGRLRGWEFIVNGRGYANVVVHTTTTVNRRPRRPRVAARVRRALPAGVGGGEGGARCVRGRADRVRGTSSCRSRWCRRTAGAGAGASRWWWWWSGSRGRVGAGVCGPAADGGGEAPRGVRGEDEQGRGGGGSRVGAAGVVCERGGEEVHT